MSVYKRGGSWWYNFVFAGQRIQESARTGSKTLAKDAEKQRRRELEEGYNGLVAEDRTRRILKLSEASDVFLKDYRLRHKPTSYSYASHGVAHLVEHLGNKMLVEIGEKSVLDYQATRLHEQASGKTINEEVMILLQIMGDIADPLRLRLKRQKRLKVAYAENVGRALSAEEEASLLAAARIPLVTAGEKVDLKATRSPLIHPVIVLALNTAMRDSEIRTLRWTRIDFLKRIITVGKSKTKAGTGRTIPINAELYRVLANYKAWYEQNVAQVAPDLYVFPYGKARAYDPTRPISTFKTAWTNVRKKAGIRVRLHDLRHTAITKLAESGAGDETIMAIAGHVSRSMLSRYAHIRTEAKRKALEAISTASADQANGTTETDQVAS
jgi:integrase